MNGRDDTTTFLPLESRIGGKNRHSCPTVGQYLTRDQTKYIYKTGRDWGDDKCRHNIARDRAGKAAR